MERYTVKSALARALYGEVMLCTDNDTGEKVAIKRMDIAAAAAHKAAGCNRHIEEDIKFEKHVHRTLNAHGGHSHVLRLRADFVEQGSEHFVFDYCGGGELFDYLSSTADAAFEPALAHRFSRQIFHAVRFMHSCGFAHRDLSLENVLLDTERQNCYVCDFGLAVPAQVVRSEVVGKAFYMAPEVVAGKDYLPAKADVWSLGIMLFMMLTGAPLFEAANDSDSRFRYMDANGLTKLVEAWSIGSRFDANTLSLLEKMLCIDPKGRPSMDEVLRHPYIVGDVPRGKIDRVESLSQAFVGLFTRRRSKQRPVEVCVASI